MGTQQSGRQSGLPRLRFAPVSGTRAAPPARGKRCKRKRWPPTIIPPSLVRSLIHLLTLLPVSILSSLCAFNLPGGRQMFAPLPHDRTTPSPSSSLCPSHPLSPCCYSSVSDSPSHDPRRSFCTPCSPLRASPAPPSALPEYRVILETGPTRS